MKFKLMLLNLGLLSLITTACGQNLNGSYTGIDQLTQAATTTTTGTSTYSGTATGTSSSSSMTMTLTQSGDNVQGTWTDVSTGTTGSISGVLSGGSLGSVIMIGSSSASTSYYGNSASSFTGCTYTGSLSYGSNVLSGSLTSSGTTTSTSTYGGYSGYGSNTCTGVTRSLQLNQSST